MFLSTFSSSGVHDVGIGSNIRRACGKEEADICSKMVKAREGEQTRWTRDDLANGGGKSMNSSAVRSLRYSNSIEHELHKLREKAALSRED